MAHLTVGGGTVQNVVSVAPTTAFRQPKKYVPLLALNERLVCLQIADQDLLDIFPAGAGLARCVHSHSSEKTCDAQGEVGSCRPLIRISAPRPGADWPGRTGCRGDEPNW